MTPLVYFAFSGDLEINYTTPINVSLPTAFVRLVANDVAGSDGSPQEITSLAIPVGSPSGKLLVTCGVIESEGSYSLQMFMYVGGRMLTQTSLDVRWPKVSMFFPGRHEAQEEAGLLRITSTATCTSLLLKYSFYIDLVFQRELSPSQVVVSEPYTNLSTALYIRKYPCNLFDLAGYYTAVLKSTYNSGTVISKTNPMTSSWSPGAYRVFLDTKTVFPCTRYLSVSYVHPPCPGMNDKLRMYALRRKVSGSLAAPIERTYVKEVAVDADQTYVAFECGLFSETAAGYCFVYVTTSSNGLETNGAVTEQHRQCISAHVDSGEYCQVLSDLVRVKY
jgi:hypothetical protein